MTGRRMAAVGLCLALALSVCGCKSPAASGGAADATVWCASGTEKILRDTDYSARYGADTLEIAAFRNENEAAQIIVSGDAGTGYDVETAGLSGPDGASLPASAFTLYHEKYINVTEIKDLNAVTGVGMYPDALLPFGVAEAYGETRLTGKNQGVWVSLKVPDTQPAGVYTGTFRVTAGGKSTDLPVRVTVYDYTLSDERHTKSSFMLDWNEISWAELSSEPALYEAYYEFMLDHRIDPQHLPGNDMVFVTMDDEQLNRFLTYADTYTRDNRCAHFNIPFDTTVTTITSGGAAKQIQCVEFVKFERTLRAMAEYSVEHGVNLFEKAGTYFVFFDEYDINGVADVANYNLDAAVDLCAGLADALADELVTPDTALKNAVLDGLRGLKHKVVGSLTSDLTAKQAQIVPTIDKYNSAAGRQLYADYDYRCYGDDGELWTYTCSGPMTPYPTYHTEDILLSSRIMSWMMYEYDIVGNLYWDAALYAWRQSNFGDLQLQDYYETALRYPAANGDGYLLYPGRPYGIDGPVGSIRLESIRDGNEDYELLYALEELYAARGLGEDTFGAVLSLMNEKLYTGTTVRVNDGLTADFSASRTLLGRLLEFVFHTGTAIESVTVAADKATVVLSAPEDTVVTADGETLSGTAADGIVRYTVERSLTDEENSLHLTAARSGATYEMSLGLGGRRVIYEGAGFADRAEITTGGTVRTEDIGGIGVLRLDYAAADRLSADIDVSALNVTEQQEDVTVRVYYYGDEARALSVFVRCERSSAYTSAGTVTLASGWNEIVIPTTTFNSARNGKLTGLRLNLGGTEAGSVALGEIIVAG